MQSYVDVLVRVFTHVCMRMYEEAAQMGLSELSLPSCEPGSTELMEQKRVPRQPRGPQSLAMLP